MAFARNSRVDMFIFAFKRAILAILNDFKETPFISKGIIGGKGPVVIISEMGCRDNIVKVKENGSFFFYCLFCLTFTLTPFTKLLLFARMVLAKLFSALWLETATSRLLTHTKRHSEG